MRDHHNRLAFGFISKRTNEAPPQTDKIYGTAFVIRSRMKRSWPRDQAGDGRAAPFCDRTAVGWPGGPLRPEPTMSLPKTGADGLRHHVTLESGGLDRMDLNGYVPNRQRELGVVGFRRNHRGHRCASAARLAPSSDAFLKAIETCTQANDVPLVPFAKGQRKDDIAAEQLAYGDWPEGVLFVGQAQEKTPGVRTEKRRPAKRGQSYPWIVRSTAMVNHDYFYGGDVDFGPFFLKLCSDFPYNAQRCRNGHEDLTRQLAKEGIAFEALDNGILSCANPQRRQALADTLDAAKIDALLRKWLARLPHPSTAQDRQAGYRYDISIRQAEFALTQVLDRPRTGRVFFAEVIRENLDRGRPDQVPWIFDRRVTKRTPGRFRPRVLTEGVTPTLHIDSKKTRLKQSHKEGRTRRTETTINATRAVGIGKRLPNLPALRAVGFQANRRRLDVQTLRQEGAVGEDVVAQVTQPIEVNGQRVAAWR